MHRNGGVGRHTREIFDAVKKSDESQQRKDYGGEREILGEPMPTAGLHIHENQGCANQEEVRSRRHGHSSRARNSCIGETFAEKKLIDSKIPTENMLAQSE